MGNKQSNGSRNNEYNPPPQQQSPQMSEAAVKRLLEVQRRQYEKKLQEVFTKTTAQDSPQATTSNERPRAPYSYTSSQLQQAAANAPPPAPAPTPSYHTPLYPNLNQSPSVPTNLQSNQDHFNFGGPLRSPTSVYNNVQTPPGVVSFDHLGQIPSNVAYRPPQFAPSAPSAPTALPSAFRPSRPAAAQRPRSQSRPRHRNMSKEERDVLDCPTCHARFGLRIFQCDSGHSSCDDCKTKGRPCGICRMALTNRRNFEVEHHVAQTKAPCPHTSEGCKLFIKLADMEAHIKECPFKELDCPLAQFGYTCRWKGKLSQLASHFDNMHLSHRQADVDSEMQLTNIRGNSRQLQLIVIGVYNFLLHLKVSEDDGKAYIAVQLIGTKTSAMKWTYEIHVYNKSECRRKYMYTDNCCSSSDNMEDVFSAGECAVLPIWYANTFVCNDAVNYKFFIKNANAGKEKKNFGKNQRGKGKKY